MLKVGDLLEGLTGVKPEGSGVLESCFSGVAIDSRLVRGGEFFIALRGEQEDGHSFVGDAFRRGASAAIVERPPEECPRPVDAAAVGRRGRLDGEIEIPFCVVVRDGGSRRAGSSSATGRLLEAEVQASSGGSDGKRRENHHQRGHMVGAQAGRDDPEK